MNEQIELGKINSLKVVRVAEQGFYLEALDENSVLLPNAYIKNDMQIDSVVDVFVYTDSEDRLVSTTLKPYAMKDEFAYLEIVDSAKFGAFADIGLAKDLLVPKNRQSSSFSVGGRKVIRVVEDERTNRLIGTEKFSQYLSKEIKDLKEKDEVDILLYSKTPLGFKVIVNNLYDGLIYHSEIFQKANIGDTKRAYIKNIREDGKIDLSLQKVGQKKSSENFEKVLDILKENGGELDFTYKSDAEDIKNTFSMSKKAFKASLTKLLADEKILLTEKSIKIN